MQRAHAQCSEELAKIIWNSSLFRVAPTLSASLLRSQIHHFGLLALTTWIPFHVLFLLFRPGKISDISLSQWENFAEAFDHALLTFCFHIRLSFHPTSLSPSPHHSSSCSPEVLHSNSRSQVSEFHLFVKHPVILPQLEIWDDMVLGSRAEITFSMVLSCKHGIVTFVPQTPNRQWRSDIVTSQSGSRSWAQDLLPSFAAQTSLLPSFAHLGASTWSQSRENSNCCSVELSQARSSVITSSQRKASHLSLSQILSSTIAIPRPSGRVHEERRSTSTASSLHQASRVAGKASWKSAEPFLDFLISSLVYIELYMSQKWHQWTLSKELSLCSISSSVSGANNFERTHSSVLASVDLRTNSVTSHILLRQETNFVRAVHFPLRRL